MGTALAFHHGRRGSLKREHGAVEADRAVVDASPKQSAPALDIAAMYRRYGPMIKRRILRFYGTDEAEEVLHEVFLKVIESPARFRGESDPGTWLYSVTTRHCLNRLRDSGRRRELWREHKGDLWYAAPAIAQQEARIFLAQLQAALPEELITIAFHYFVDGMTHAEIARVLGISRRTVGNRLVELEEAARRAADR